MRRFLILPIIALLCTALHANMALTQRKDVQNFINFMVEKHHFDRKYLMWVMDDVKLQSKVIESMEKPYEKKSWDIYQQLFLTDERLQAGLNFWQANQQALAQAEKQYQVPANIIVAILGVETLYGKKQGEYRVIDALSTLAFNYPKRANFFTNELVQYLLLCREQKIAPNQYLGSYAGAIGKPQFMPSSYRYYATNFTGLPKKDLVRDDDAVIASVANYLHKHGWQMHQGIAQPAKISGSHHPTINTNYKRANYNLTELTKAGVQPITASLHDTSKVGLIALNTQTATEYWLAYPNFYVITRYNTSPQYAMVVYLLAQQLQRHWLASKSTKRYAYV